MSQLPLDKPCAVTIITGMTTYRTFGDALADPNSQISKFVADAEDARRGNDEWLAQREAEGMTREQAYMAMFAEMRKQRAR